MDILTIQVLLLLLKKVSCASAFFRTFGPYPRFLDYLLNFNLLFEFREVNLRDVEKEILNINNKNLLHQIASQLDVT